MLLTVSPLFGQSSVPLGSLFDESLHIRLNLGLVGSDSQI